MNTWLHTPRSIAEWELRLLGHRYLYYVLGEPVVDDNYYDLMEQSMLPHMPEDSLLRQPGSDKAKDYPPVVALAAMWLTKPNGRDVFENLITEWEKTNGQRNTTSAG